MLEVLRDGNGNILAVCEWDKVSKDVIYVRELEASAGFKGVVRWALKRFKEMNMDVSSVTWTREYKYPGREYITKTKECLLRRAG